MKLVSAFQIGRGHVKNNTPCQDYTDTYSYNQRNRKGLIVLCDGAGSSRLSHIAAKAFVDEIGVFFERSIQMHSKKKLKRLILKLVLSKTKELAIEHQCAVNDLYATLLFVYVDKTNKNIVYGHIGDGIIAVSKGGEFSVLSEPDNGEFANSTYFINGKNSSMYFNVNKIRLSSDIDGFAIMSDGSAESLYNAQHNRVATALSTMLTWMDTHDEKTVEHAIQDALEKTLSQKTTDDLSLALVKL